MCLESVFIHYGNVRVLPMRSRMHLCVFVWVEALYDVVNNQLCMGTADAAAAAIAATANTAAIVRSVPNMTACGMGHVDFMCSSCTRVLQYFSIHVRCASPPVCVRFATSKNKSITSSGRRCAHLGRHSLRASGSK